LVGGDERALRHHLPKVVVYRNANFVFITSALITLKKGIVIERRYLIK